MLKLILLAAIALPILLIVLLVLRGGRILRLLGRGAMAGIVLLLVLGVVATIARQAGFDIQRQASAVRPTEALDTPHRPAPPTPPRAPRLDEDAAADAEKATASIRTSSIAIDYEQRPDWVESTPEVDTGGVDRIAVSSGPWVLRRESRAALDKEIKLAADDYISDYLQSDMAALLLDYDVSDLKGRLVRPGHGYEETIQVSVGPMHQRHALLEFGPAFRQELDERWQRVMATSRLLQTGLGAGAVLTLLGLALAYLRLDTATRGYYTRRLQFGAVAAILALMVAGAYLAQWIPWI